MPESNYLEPEDREAAERFFDGVPPDATATLAELHEAMQVTRLAGQPAPVHQPGVVGTHDRVIGDLESLTCLPVSNRKLTTAMRAAMIRGFEARRDVGLETYGTPLQPDNGRDSVRDALEEALDMAVYLYNATREGQPVQCSYNMALEIVADLVPRVGL